MLYKLTRYKLFFILSILLLTLFPLSGYGANQRIPFTTTLENGLKVIIEEDHSAPVVALQLWVSVGSADEKDEEAGVAHVIEHMLFKGTKRRGVGDIAREIQNLGGNINAFTSYDNTTYHITIASRFFNKGLDILSDMVINSVFDPVELRKEIQVVIEELKRGEDTPSSKLYKKLLATAYTEHPYRRPVIGYKKTLEALTRDMVINFYKTWYVPNNMNLVIVGDVDISEVLPKIEEAFKTISAQSLPARIRVIEPPQRNFKEIIITHKVKKAGLELTFHIPGINDSDVYAIDLLANILGEGRSSRLYRNVKDKKGLVRDVSTYAMTPRDPGLFFISADLEPGKTQEALESILQEIEKVQREGVNLNELERAKLNLESDFIYQRETVQGKAREWGYYETIAGDLRFEERYLKGIRKVTEEDIKRVANKYLSRDNLTFGLLLPEEKKGVVKIGDLEAIVLKKTSSKKESSITKRVLENGITLIIKENHSNPTVSVYGVFLGGLITEDRENNGIANITARMFTRGTTGLSAEEIASRIESIAGSINGFSGRNTIGLSGRFLSRFFDKGLKLYADILLHPTFPGKELKKVKGDVLSDIRTQEDDLTRTTINLLDRNLFPNHPYGMNPLGKKETVERISKADILRYYETYVKGSNMVLSIVGDVDTQHVIQKVKGLFKEMKKGKPVAVSLPQGAEERRGIKKSELIREREQAHIALGFIGPSFNNPDRYPMEILTEVMTGMGGRLFVELRDKQGLAYVVTAFLRSGYNAGSFVVYMATSPENLIISIDGIKKELGKIVSEGLTEEEVEKAKMSIIGSYEIGLQSNSAQASDMALNELFGFGFDEFKRYPQKISEVSMEEIKRVAEKYIRLNNYTLAILKPPPMP